nr:MAG TPA: hypothetical protein [Caudoviricetes sp.]
MPQPPETCSLRKNPHTESQLGEDSRRNPRQLLAPGIPAIGIDN